MIITVAKWEVELIGLVPYRFKLVAFILGGALAGLGGSVRSRTTGPTHLAADGLRGRAVPDLRIATDPMDRRTTADGHRPG